MAGLLQRWRGKKNGGQLGCNQQFGPWVVGIELCEPSSGLWLGCDDTYRYRACTHQLKFGSVPLAAKY